MKLTGVKERKRNPLAARVRHHTCTTQGVKEDGIKVRDNVGRAVGTSH
jgi:hypothetical protein